jgi:hypothetical protein
VILFLMNPRLMSSVVCYSWIVAVEMILSDSSASERQTYSVGEDGHDVVTIKTAGSFKRSEVSAAIFGFRRGGP